MYVQLRLLEVKGGEGLGEEPWCSWARRPCNHGRWVCWWCPGSWLWIWPKACEDRWLKHTTEGAAWCQASKFKCGLLILRIEWGVGFTKITNLYNWALENGQWAAVSGYLIKKAGLMLAGHLGALILSKGPFSCPWPPQRTAAPSCPLSAVPPVHELPKDKIQ